MSTVVELADLSLSLSLSLSMALTPDAIQFIRSSLCLTACLPTLNSITLSAF